jgi:hypothetical protein
MTLAVYAQATESADKNAARLVGDLLMPDERQSGDATEDGIR